MNKLYTLLFMSLCLVAFSQEQSPPFIDVTGTAEMEVIPDEIYIAITLHERSGNRDTQTVQEQESDLKDALRSLGLDLKRLELYPYFRLLYSIYLNRSLGDGEGNVLDTAIKIMLWKVHGKTFKNICWYRYSHASKTNERANLEKHGRNTNQITANFITGYHPIPDKDHNVYSLFPPGTRAVDVDYDLIMTDTYDFIDKLISFKLTDVFYTSFIKYFQKENDTRAEKLAKFIKYGTDNERHIWMLRYGMSFEDIEKLEPHILSINAEEIVFKKSILEVPKEERYSIERFIRIQKE